MVEDIENAKADFDPHRSTLKLLLSLTQMNLLLVS